MGKQGFYRNRQLAYEWLKATFPAIFGRDTPLKVGIHRDILVYDDENKPANIHVRHAIAMHESRSSYLLRMKVGVERIDLAGLGCGQFVSDEEARLAKAKRCALQERYKSKKRQANNKPQEKPIKEQMDEIKVGESGRSILTLKKKAVA